MTVIVSGVTTITVPNNGIVVNPTTEYYLYLSAGSVDVTVTLEGIACTTNLTAATAFRAPAGAVLTFVLNGGATATITEV